MFCCLLNLPFPLRGRRNVEMEGGEELVPEPEMTPAEREIMKQSVIDNLKSIHALIHHYQQSQQQLQEEVAEFVLRDVDEQNQLHCIGARVETSQREALNNPSYVRWASANGKGEFAERRQGAENHNDEGAEDDDDDGSMWYEYVEDPYLPQTIVPLDVYSGVAAHLAGWRGANSGISSQLSQLASDLANVNGTASSLCMVSPSKQKKAAPSSCLVINGEIIFPESTVMNASASAVQASFTTGNPNFAASAEVAYMCWWNETIRRASKGVCSEEQILQSLSKSPQVRQVVRGANDVVSMIPSSALEDAAIIRFFARGGLIKAVEVLSPEIDVASVVFPSSKTLANGRGGSGHTTDEQLLDAASTFLRLNPRLAQFSTHTIVMAIAVKRSSDTSSPYMFVALDGRQLNPELPFKWFLSWTEACGLSQVETTGPSVRRCKVKVAQLTPNDELSEKQFSLVNDARSGVVAALPPAATNVEESRQVEQSDRSAKIVLDKPRPPHQANSRNDRKGLLLIGAAVSVAAALFLVSSAVRKNRQR